MKIQAILFMCNDFDRAKFTLQNFYKWNPDIPIRIINSGGDSPEPYLQHIPNTQFIDAPNLWHKNTHCGKGSFGPEFANYFFDLGLNSNFTHTLLLETDVLTNRRICIAPKYEISGPCNMCGNNELVLYKYLNISSNFIHTGCGGTIFTHKYFQHIYKHNFNFFSEMFIAFPSNYFMDLILTLAARVSGLSFGTWDEVSNIPNHIVDGKLVNNDMSKTLIHNYKV